MYSTCTVVHIVFFSTFYCVERWVFTWPTYVCRYWSRTVFSLSSLVPKRYTFCYSVCNTVHSVKQLHTHTYAASPPTELIATHQQNQISTIFGSWVSTVRSVCRAWRSSTARSSSQPWASRVRTLYGYSAVSHRLVRHCAFICLLITYGVSDYSRGFWD